jgi:citrate lyase gamma subunit
MESFKRCRRRHYFEYEVGIRKQTDAKALRMGSAGHEGLDVLKQGRELTDALDVIWRLYAIMPDGMDEREWAIERETVECLVTGYQWRWTEQPLDVLVTEQSFRLPLVNPATGAASTVWDTAGKIDGIVRLEDGRLAVLEHKFISDPLDQDGDYWRRLQIDSQISLYVWAARQLGHEVETVLYDVVRKPTIRPNEVAVVDADGLRVVLDANGERVLTKQGKPRQTGDTASGYVLQTRPMTVEEWSEKLLGDIQARPEFYYARIEIARLDSDIAEMMDEVWELQQTVREAENKGRWYKTVSRDTCPFCAFFGLCGSRFDASTGEIPEGFVKVDCVHPELEEVVQ